MPARNLRIWRELLFRSWDPSYLERQRLVSRWVNDLVPFPGEAYRQLVKELVQAKRSCAVTSQSMGIRLIPRRSPARCWSWPHWRCPCTPESTQALLEGVSGADRQAVTVSGGTLGHVDIVVGPEGPAIMWPKLTAWLETRSGAGR